MYLAGAHVVVTGAARVVRVVERGRGSVVMPALVAPTHHLRALPSYLTDGLLAGIREEKGFA